MTPSPQREPQTLHQQIQSKVEQRREEISRFVTGALSGEERQRFVDEMKSDRALRLAVMEVRRSVPENLIPLSGNAVQLIEEMIQGIRQGNMLFPGNPFIAGLENRPDIGPSREENYRKTEAAAEKLLELQEVEDLALENRIRVFNNIASGREAQRRFPGYSNIGNIEGMFASSAADPADYSRPAGAMLPAEFKCAPTDLSKSSLTGPSLAHAKAIAQFDSLCGDRENNWRYQLFGRIEFNSISRRDELINSLETDVDFLAAVNRSITEPIKGTPEPAIQILRKLVAINLLCCAAENTNDERFLTAPFCALESLTTSARTGTFLENEKRLLDGCVSQLTLAAQTNAQVWNALSPILARELSAAYQDSLPTDSKKRFPPTLYLRALEHLGDKMSQDEQLFNTVTLFLEPPEKLLKGGSYDLKESLVDAALRAIARAKKPEAIEILLQGLVHPDLMYSTECARLLVKTDMDLTDFNIQKAFAMMEVDSGAVEKRFEYYRDTEIKQKALAEMKVINERLRTIATFEELAVVALDSLVKLRHQIGFSNIEWNLELINKFNPSRMEEELGKFLECSQVLSDDLSAIAHFCSHHKTKKISGQLVDAYLKAKGDLFLRGESYVEFLKEFGVSNTELDERFRNLMDTLSVGDFGRLNLISKAYTIGVLNTTLKACELTLQSDDGVSREHAMRTLREISNESEISISEDIVRRIIFLAERNESIKWALGRISERKEAVQTLVDLARGPNKEVVFNTIEEELTASEEGSSRLGSNHLKEMVPMLRALSSLRDLTDYEVNEALGTEISPEKAFDQFIRAFADRPEELKHVLNSFKYRPSDRIGPSEKLARDAVVEALGEETSSQVFQYLSSQSPLSEQTIQAVTEAINLMKQTE